MSDLTEVEILDCLYTNLRSAINHCRAIGKLPAQGPSYVAFRQELKLTEGACRQIGHWREDSRWLTLGFMTEEAHQRVGNWIRYHNPRPLFSKLADNLQEMHRVCKKLELEKTGRSGTILPELGHDLSTIKKENPA